MESISRFILFIDNYFLLSSFSKTIIQWSLTALILFSLLTLIFKKTPKPTFTLYIGFAVRIALLIGISIEMFHQVKVTELTELYYNKTPSYRQFLHFMFFGYIIVSGFYYMITLNQKKYKGLFYTFDIAILTMPILQLLTSFIINVRKEGFLLDDFVVLLIILLVTSTLIYLFFVSYWKKRLKFIVPFYLVIFFCLLFQFSSLVIGTGILEFVEVVNLYLFLGLLMTYHLLNTSENKFVYQGKKPFVVVLTIIFVILVNPFYNIGNLALATTNAEVKLRYYQSTDLVTLSEAEEIAEISTGDDDFFLRQNAHEDFHNRYFFESENYTVDVDGVSEAVMNLHRKTDPMGRKLQKEEYVTKSKKLLQSIGRTLKEEQLHIEASKKGDTVEVKMLPKVTDGSTLKDQWGTVFVWEKESLIEFHEKVILYPLESLKNVALTDEDIAKK
ncbi:hypothetical protein ACFFIX_19160 [Metabacillus herbersteinensis]|uniref:Uncharacterized protein n=1 Tax=Metabacillus herbersteinensis TaxID=283816 RepID=A0ABV6GIJ9_9BACI